MRENQIHGPVGASSGSPSRIRQLWRVRLPKGSFGAVTLSGQSAFVGSDDGYVYELNRSDGAVIRRFFIGTAVTPQPLVWRGRLFVGEGVHTSHQSRIYSFDLGTGKLLGAFATRGHTEGGLVIASDHGVDALFVMAGRDGVYSLDPTTLKVNWHLIAGHTDSEVRVERGRVYFSTGMEEGFRLRNHFALSVDFHTGAVLWKIELPQSGWMPPVLYGKVVCFGMGEIYGKAAPGQWNCLDQDTGELRQSLAMAGPILSIPLRVGSEVALADTLGNVCAVSLTDGSRRWCHATRGETYASVNWWKGLYVYPSSSDGILLLSPVDGRTLVQWKPSAIEGGWAKSFSRVDIENEEGYLADMDGNVRRLQFEKEEPTRSSHQE